MTPKQIYALRRKLGESRLGFSKRFGCSRRTIENWEQGRCEPGLLVVSIMKALEKGNKATRKRG